VECPAALTPDPIALPPVRLSHLGASAHSHPGERVPTRTISYPPIHFRLEGHAREDDAANLGRTLVVAGTQP